MDHTDKSPQDLSALIAEGVSLVTAGKAESAKAIFDEVLARDPSCAKAFCGRGSAFLIMGQIDEAIRNYDAALSIDPKYARQSVALASQRGVKNAESCGRQKAARGSRTPCEGAQVSAPARRII